MAIGDLMMALLRSELCAEAISPKMKTAISPEVLKELYALSDRQSLAHLVGQALSKSGLLGKDEISAQFHQRTMAAVTRHIQKSNAYYCICNALEKACVPFIPLKGSVIREWYPESWMRTSSDIDILVKESDVEQVTEILVKEHGYTGGLLSTREISFYSPLQVHLELHFDLIEDTVSKEQNNILSKVWDMAMPAKGAVYRHEMPAEMFRLYHFAHMAKHMRSGGIGVRFFIDLWLMDQKMKWDVSIEEEMLHQCGLSAFAKAAEGLAQTWFGNAPADPLVEALGEYVLTGSTYGDMKKRVAIRQSVKGSKFMAVFIRVFPRYDSLKLSYPILEKHKWLFPFYQVVRWCRLLFTKDAERSIAELKLALRNKEEDSVAATVVLKQLELL